MILTRLCENGGVLGPGGVTIFNGNALSHPVLTAGGFVMLIYYIGILGALAGMGVNTLMVVIRCRRRRRRPHPSLPAAVTRPPLRIAP